MNQTQPAVNTKLIRTLIISYEREIKAVALYRMLAEREKDERRRGIFTRLADSEEKHAGLFAERIVALGGAAPDITRPPGVADKLVTRFLGSDAMLRRMEAEEERNMALFNQQAHQANMDDDSRALYEMVERDEVAHTKTLATMGSPNEPATRLEAILKGEKWHVSTGSWIGDAIYGVNDGLGAVFGIVSGVAGYSHGGHEVVVAGMFGMLASALSMGSGAFLAAKSEREVFEAQVARERQEIETDPEHEKEELALIYQLKGFSEEESVRMAETIAAQPEQFLKTMTQEELGLSEQHFPNPWIALVSSTLATAVGALIPVIPFFFMEGIAAVIVSALISTLAHFAVGAAKSLVTARGWFASGMEMTIVGVIEAVISYGLGMIFAPSPGARG